MQTYRNLKNPLFWYITLCIPLKVIWRFEGTWLLQLQDRRISHVENQHEAGSKQKHGSLQNPEDGGNMFLKKFNGIHLVMRANRTLHNHRCGNVKFYTFVVPSTLKMKTVHFLRNVGVLLSDLMKSQPRLQVAFTGTAKKTSNTTAQNLPDRQSSLNGDQETRLASIYFLFFFFSPLNRRLVCLWEQWINWEWESKNTSKHTHTPGATSWHVERRYDVPTTGTDRRDVKPGGRQLHGSWFSVPDCTASNGKLTTPWTSTGMEV